MTSEEYKIKHREQQQKYRLLYPEKVKESREKWLKANKEKQRESSRRGQAKYRKNNPEKVKEALEKWRIKNTIRRRIHNKKWRENNPEKKRAENLVQAHVKLGKIEKEDYCFYCGTTEKIEAHHPDYSRALEIIWACRPCHARIHSQGNKGGAR